MRLLMILAMGVVLTTSGCIKVGPDFISPKADVADAWSEPDNAVFQVKSEPHQEWWTVFNDPVLNNLVEKAYHQNLSLQIAGLRVLEARARLGIATGNLYPQQQQVGASTATVGGSRNAANSAAGDLRYKELTTDFTVGWELDFWGKFRRGVEAADAQYLANIARYDDVMVTLTAEVARTYIILRTLEERVKLAEASTKIQERSLQIAENRYEGGLVTELDVQQARSLLANTKAAIPNYRAEYRRAENALSVLLGLPPGNLSAVLAPGQDKGIPHPPTEVAVGVPADLLRRRPDVRRAELETAAQSALVGVSEADLYPHFTLFGTIGLQTSDSPLTREGGSHFSDLFSSDSVAYFAGPSLTWDVFNYGRIKNQVRVQDARLQQLVVNYRDTVLNAAREVEDAMAGFIEDQVRAGYLTQAVTASRRSVDISSLQYSEGLTDYQRVLDAQRGLTVDQDSLAIVKGAVAVNLVNMFKALGGGWQVQADRDFVNPATRQEMARRTDWGKLLETEQTPADAPDNRATWPRPDW